MKHLLITYFFSNISAKNC